MNDYNYDPGPHIINLVLIVATIVLMVLLAYCAGVAP